MFFASMRAVCACSVIMLGGLLLAPPANAQSLMNNHVLSRASTALIEAPRSSLLSAPQATQTGADPAAQPVSLQTGSLFSGRAKSSLFAPRATATLPKATAPGSSSSGTGIGPIMHTGVVGLRALIASAEAGSMGYDAVQFQARIKPPKAPTQMTIREIYKWIDDTPGQQHAIGRYQFIPNTLRRLVTQLGLDLDTRFSPRVQDLAADILLEDAGLSKFLRGELSQRRFMNNLGRIWAGFPNEQNKSHYEGIANNKAVMTWARFEAQIEQIFPRG